MSEECIPLIGQMTNAQCCKPVIGRPEGKRPLERPNRECEDNIKMALKILRSEMHLNNI
jgi:hypothetical protein